ncbi:MAG: ParB/RepB/Spo0J family partition protein [Chloroflexi bacterium]|nr:ParB/RepB/Spo0J family partition protein [Chloroflexota bacterium]
MADLELKKIQPNKLGPDLTFSKVGLDELASSIKQYGVLEPIMVRPSNGHFEVVVGERRYRAAQQAGLDSVPVVIKNYSDEEVMEINLVENMQREDLSAVEKAKLCQEMRSRWPDRYPTYEKIAKRIGVDSGTVRTWMRTLHLPEEVQVRIAPRESQRVPDGKIAYRTALAIAEHIKEPAKQIQIAAQIAEERMPKAAAREFIRKTAAESKPTAPKVVQEVVRDSQPTLVFNHRNYKSVLSGSKTQATRRRVDPNIREGSLIRGAVSYFADLQVEGITRKRLKELTALDAEREGGYSLEEFKAYWTKQYGKWNPDEVVSLVRFKVVRVR